MSTRIKIPRIVVIVFVISIPLTLAIFVSAVYFILKYVSFVPTTISDDTCMADIDQWLETSSIEDAYEKNHKDYVVAYRNSEEDYPELTEKIIRITEYQKTRVPIVTEEFEDLFLFIDVYFNAKDFALRKSLGDETETGAMAYATGFNEIVALVEKPDNPDDNIRLYRAFSHELVHLLQMAKYKDLYGSAFEAYRMPRWYLEGMATYYEFCIPSVESLVKDTEFDTLQEIDNAHLYSDDPGSAYLVSYLFYTFLAERYDEDTVLRLGELNYSDFYEEAEGILGESLESLYNEWRD